LYAQKQALRLVLSRHRPYTADNALLSIGPAYRAFVAQAALRAAKALTNLTWELYRRYLAIWSISVLFWEIFAVKRMDGSTGDRS
jgi:hypothetical protein